MVKEFEQWKKKVAGIESGSEETGKTESEVVSSEGSPAVATAGSLQVVLRLTIQPGDGKKEKTMEVLKTLKDGCSKLPGFISYQIFDNEGEDEILVLQNWANQQALDAYYSQPFFQEATPKFAGLLADHPDYRTYIAS